MDQPMPLNLKSLKTRFALRFLRALKNINHQEIKTTHDQRLTNNNGFLVAQRYLRVKVAADASMASAVGPRRAWSRAMLLRIRPARSRRQRREIVRRRKQQQQRERGATTRRHDDSQAQELRRLVPGGEDMDLQGLLDETAHYIKCLTTQVKVMRSIVNYCSTG